MKILLEPFTFLYKYRKLLWQTTKSDIRTKYAGSLLGLVWLFLYPLLLLGAYAAVYIFIFKVKFQLFNSNEYVLLIFCGLIPFIGFSEALGNGVSSVVSNSSLIKNTMFPIELVPVKAVFVSQTTQVAGTILLLIGLLSFGKWTALLPLFVFIWVFQILFTLGLIWILSSVNVYARDLQSIIGVLILFLMMISPIAYTVDMIPEYLRPFLSLNPIYYLTVSNQNILMLGKLPPTSTFITLACFSLATFVLGYWFFKKMKRVFIDNV